MSVATTDHPGEPRLDPGRIPAHVAIIMDGNGRWATRRHLPVGAGHRAGVKALRRVLEHALDLGIQEVTVFSFSSENWTRPGENPPVGLILCAQKDAAVARDALEGLANKVLAAEYRTALPKEKLLAAEITRTRATLERRRATPATRSRR